MVRERLEYLYGHGNPRRRYVGVYVDEEPTFNLSLKKNGYMVLVHDCETSGGRPVADHLWAFFPESMVSNGYRYGHFFVFDATVYEYRHKSGMVDYSLVSGDNGRKLCFIKDHRLCEISVKA
jgi:hypothetical protein